MGVSTSADDYVQEARNAIQQAIKSLAEVVIDECYGHEDYDANMLRETMNELIQMKNKL